VEDDALEIRQLKAQLVQAQNTEQVELIDRKLAVLKKYQE
jgi:hypothetical protein